MSKPAILCVDDEVIILDSLKIQLKEAFGEAYTYEAAESADEALEIIEELEEEGEVVIVIVSDWLMPGLKGDEFLIQVHQQHPRVVKIMLTGQAEEAAIERAIEHAKLHSYLRKPWTEEELIEAIRTGMAKL